MKEKEEVIQSLEAKYYRDLSGMQKKVTDLELNMDTLQRKFDVYKAENAYNEYIAVKEVKKSERAYYSSKLQDKDGATQKLRCRLRTSREKEIVSCFLFGLLYTQHILL